MNPFVPTDLLDIPAIAFFKYRNNGTIDDPIDAKTVKRYLAFYRKNPRKLFVTKERINGDKLEWIPTKLQRGFQLSKAIVKTPYQPIVKDILALPKFHPVKQLRLQRYKKNIRDGKKNCILFIHGYAEGTFFFHEQSYFWIFNQLLDSDIYAMELPHHHARQPTDSPFSGAYFLNGNPVRMLEAFRQSIQEICIFARYLKEQYDNVAIFGVSLGGHLTALSSQFIDSVRIIAALASPFLFRLNPKIAPVSKSLVSKLKTEGLLGWYKILYACNMKYFYPFTTNQKTAIIGGRYDRIVPFPRVQSLANMLQKPLFAYPGGHISLVFWVWPLLRKIDHFFDSG
ncbi:MAG: hypothetical protein ACFFFG_04725 [Candidatus Thorarchaeota archaeon]